MDVLVECEEALRCGDVDAAAAQSFLDAPSGADEAVLTPVASAEVLLECTRRITKCNNAHELTDRSVALHVKRIGASAYSTLSNARDLGASVAAARLLLALCAVNGASAYGVSNTNVVTAIASALLKAVVHEVKCPALKVSRTQPAGRKKAATTTTAAASTEGEQGTRRSARGGKKTQGGEEAEGGDDDDDVGGDGDDRGDDDEDNNIAYSQGPASQQQQEEDEESSLFGKASSASESKDLRKQALVRVDAPSLRGLVVDIKANLGLFWQRSEDYPLECVCEGLSACVFLSSMRPEFASIAKDSVAALASLGVTSERSLMSVYKALMPALTMAGRDARLPDVGMHKQRAQCHKAAVGVVAQLASACGSMVQQWADSADEEKTKDQEQDAVAMETMEEDEVEGEKKEEDEEEEKEEEEEEEEMRGGGGKKAKAAKKVVVAHTTTTSSTSALPVPFACIVGVMQRMTIAVPDRAPPRSTVLASLSLLLCILAEDESGDVHAQAAANHFLLFLAKLSRSSKVSYRAYCLDIATAIMGCEWLWNYSSRSRGGGGGGGGDAAVGPKALVSMLMGRCDDAAPTVRVRAIGAICDLLEGLGPESPKSKCEVLLAFALGGGGEGEEASVSLLDILRIRTTDDKPMVRAKAIQAFGIAMCLSWPKHTPLLLLGNGETELTFVDMFISEEDIAVLSEQCGDKSLAARKQALASLSAFVKARPSNANLQQAWVLSVLPLATDPESTVHAKLAASCYDLLFDGLVQWAATLSGGKMSSKKAAAAVAGTTESPESALVWSLCARIASAGPSHVKMLRSCVGVMLQQGLIKTQRESVRDASSLKNILAAIRLACCASLTPPEASSSSSPSASSECVAISRGGWVLLEAIMGQDASPGQEHAASAALAGDSGAADFVVQCFMSNRSAKQQQAAADAVLLLDDDDVRMLRVLEKLAKSVSSADAKAMSSTLQKLLLTMSLDAAGAAAAMAVECALSKAAGQAVNDTNVSNEEMRQWSGELLATVYSVLYAGVWGTLPRGQQEALYASVVPAAMSHATRAILTTNVDDGKEEGGQGGSGGVGGEAIEAKNSKLASALFVMGEVAMLGFSVEEDEARKSSSSAAATTTSQAKAPAFTISEVTKSFRMCVPEPLVLLVQLLMDTRLPLLGSLAAAVKKNKKGGYEGGGEEGEEGGGALVSENVRANAFVCMGKLCLRDRTRARDMINVFLRELAHSQPAGPGAAAVRSNSLLVLGDLCVRFTNLVDRHVGTMAACLQDKEVLVRRHALVLLTQLLLQDFLRWKGLLLFRFLASCVDADAETAELAKVVLRRTLLVKHPDFFSQHMSESVLVFNACTQHPVYAAAANSGAEGSACTVTMEGVELGGGDASSRARRLRVYGMMMEGFSEEQKIQVTAKLVQDILGFAVDSSLSLVKDRSHVDVRSNTTPFEDALEDALLILTSPLLRVGRKTGGGGGDDEDDEGFGGGGEEEPSASQEPAAGGKATTLAGAKSKVLKTLSKQHLIGHTLPVLSSLKHLLEASRSSLQGVLMDCLLNLVKHNKAEVAEALSSDPMLKAEIEYDMKKHEKAKERANVERHAQAIDAAQREATEALAAQAKASSSFSPRSPRRASKAHLRKSLGGPGSALRTPIEALRASTGKGKGSAAMALEEDDANNNDDLADRLLGGGGGGAGGVRFDDDDLQQQHDQLLQQQQQRQQTTSRRRSWSVVVGSLGQAEGDEGKGGDENKAPKQRNNTKAKGAAAASKASKKKSSFTPAKKRGKKTVVEESEDDDEEEEDEEEEEAEEAEEEEEEEAHIIAAKAAKSSKAVVSEAAARSSRRKA